MSNFVEKHVPKLVQNKIDILTTKLITVLQTYNLKQ